MPTVITFLKPTIVKMVFLAEWALFILITAARGDLKTNHQALVAGYPLIFFYLVACALAALNQHIRQIAKSWRLFVFGGGLFAVDQIIKTLIIALVPYQSSLPIVNNWLHLAHEHNSHGSWIASVFNVQSVCVFNLMQWGLAIPILFLAILCHRYYITNHRQSIWVDVALLGVLSGYASWICDMSLRGYIIDFINLPGLVTADLKDILITIGVAALFAEALDNPQLSWRWGGWQKERDDLIRLVKGLYSFAGQEVHEVWQAMMRKLR
ncbi:MAG: signal peptidase II [Anaerolineales bacterium]|nr:signal peptidase II [Anaerolineales bacterium]